MDTHPDGKPLFVFFFFNQTADANMKESLSTIN